MKITRLFETIHNSIQNANKLFSDWTGGWWMQDYGVEGFLVTRIAEGIMGVDESIRPGFLTLETSFDELYESTKLPRGNPGEFGKHRNRVDIALWHKNETLSHVIEVKRYWSEKSKADLYRLCKLFDTCGKLNDSTLKGAVYVQLISAKIASKQDSIEPSFKIIEEKCKQYVNKKKLDVKISRGIDYINPMIREDGTQAFSSLCVSITK